MPAMPQKSFSFAEYLMMEERAEQRHEFYDGEIYAMAGGTFNHALIRTNFNRKVGNLLEEQSAGCYTIDGDLKVYIQEANAATYPDGMVLCEEPHFVAGKNHIIDNPTLIVEVLSKSTAEWDRGGKFRRYELLPGLKEYVLIEQNEMAVEVYRRNEHGFFVRHPFTQASALVELHSVNITIPLAEIYQRVQFSEKTMAD